MASLGEISVSLKLVSDAYERAVKRALGQTDKLADSTKELTDEQKKLQGSTDKAGASIGAMGGKALAAVGGLTALVAVATKAVTEFASVEAASGRLERTFARSNAASGDYAKAIEVLRQRSATLGVSYEAQLDGLNQLVGVTGNATQALDDLALASDIAAAEGRELKDVVEMLRKARNGEVEELKQLDGINKDAAESMGRIKDAALRGKTAIDVLTKSYSGAAEEVAGTEEKLSAFEETGKRALALGGNLATKIGSGLADAFVAMGKAVAGADLSLQGLNTSMSRMEKFSQSAKLTDWLAITFSSFDEAQAHISAVNLKSDADQLRKDNQARISAGMKRAQGMFKNPVAEIDDHAIALARSAEEYESFLKKQARIASAATARVKKADSGIRDAALAAGESFLGEQQANRDARSREVSRIGSGMSAAIAETDATLQADRDARRNAVLATSGPSTRGAGMAGLEALSQQSELASASLSVLTSGVTGLIGPFTQLWMSSEKMGEVFALLDTALDPLRRFIDMIGGELLKVLEPVMKLFDALSPILQAVLAVMNPIILPLKILGGLFTALAKPIEWLVTSIRKAVNSIDVFIRNIGRKKKNKAYLDDEGNIIDPKDDDAPAANTSAMGALAAATEDAAGAVGQFATETSEAAEEMAKIPAHIQRTIDRLVAAGRAASERMGVFVEPLATLGFGSGAKEIWGSFSYLQDALDNAAGGMNSAAESAREVASSLTNVPEIFRANLRRGQVAGTGAVSGGSGGGVYVAGNVIVQGGDVDEFSRNLQRQRYVRTGETYSGMAAMSGLAAAG